VFLCLEDHLRTVTPGLLLRYRAQTRTRPVTALTPRPRAGTELTYCALSLTAKLYLGWCAHAPTRAQAAAGAQLSDSFVQRRFILLNVVVVSPEEGGAEGALKDTSEAVR